MAAESVVCVSGPTTTEATVCPGPYSLGRPREVGAMERMEKHMFGSICPTLIQATKTAAPIPFTQVSSLYKHSPDSTTHRTCNGGHRVTVSFFDPI